MMSDNAIHQQMVIGAPVILPTKDYRRIMLADNGWFTWDGKIYDITGKSVGGGLTRMTAANRYPARTTGSTEP